MWHCSSSSAWKLAQWWSLALHAAAVPVRQSRPPLVSTILCRFVQLSPYYFWSMAHLPYFASLGHFIVVMQSFDRLQSNVWQKRTGTIRIVAVSDVTQCHMTMPPPRFVDPWSPKSTLTNTHKTPVDCPVLQFTTFPNYTVVTEIFAQNSRTTNQ